MNFRVITLVFGFPESFLCCHTPKPLVFWRFFGTWVPPLAVQQRGHPRQYDGSVPPVRPSAVHHCGTSWSQVSAIQGTLTRDSTCSIECQQSAWLALQHLSMIHCLQKLQSLCKTMVSPVLLDPNDCAAHYNKWFEVWDANLAEV